MKKLSVVVILMAAFSSYSFAKDFLWIGYDLPPYHVIEGKGKGEGVLDFAYTEYKKSLTGHNHRIRFVNINRMVAEMKNKSVNSCVTASFKLPGATEGRVWSKALYKEPPAMLVVRRETFKAMGEPRSISLDAVLSDPKHKFGHFNKRAYYGRIDEILKKHEKNRNFHKVTTKKGTYTILKMIEMKRLDSGLYFPAEIGYMKRALDLSGEFNTIALEGVDTTIPVYANCIDNAWGRTQLAHIEKMVDADFRKKVRAQYISWLMDENSVRAFEKANADLR